VISSPFNAKAACEQLFMAMRMSQPHAHFQAGMMLRLTWSQTSETMALLLKSLDEIYKALGDFMPKATTAWKM
jgi:hypothetical protein